ncbi:hypothetical protein NUW58_g8885 [Xylaria curta]|uniref:Uncharacterized protein n=1 Tax=Xylaria curta TaxID=42375 RepID=A0ACC1N3K1_9PEZI|nr:hypothetical protein NUW58_g8885 [Xylaria curta]
MHSWRDAARELGAAQGVGDLLGVARLVDEAGDVLARAPLQGLALLAIAGVDADGHGGPRVQVQLVHADAHVPVLQHLAALGQEEGTWATSASSGRARSSPASFTLIWAVSAVKGGKGGLASFPVSPMVIVEIEFASLLFSYEACVVKRQLAVLNGFAGGR